MELKQDPSGPTTKKNLGAPGPPTGEIWGVKVSTSPPSSISLRQISEIFRPQAGRIPGYNPRDIGNPAGNVAGDIFSFILAPGPRYYRGAQTYKSESIYYVGYSSTLGVVGVDAGNAVTPSTGPLRPTTGACPTTVDVTKAPFPTVYMTRKGQKRQTGSSMVT